MKTPRRCHPDTCAWWIVQDGQTRFHIEGQEPLLVDGTEKQRRLL